MIILTLQVTIESYLNFNEEELCSISLTAGLVKVSCFPFLRFDRNAFAELFAAIVPSYSLIN